MNTIDTAPKGGGADYVTDPNWVEPPLILLMFEEGKFSVARWDWYYAESGSGYREAQGCDAWIDDLTGELVELYYGKPLGWYDLKQLTKNES